MGKRYSTEEALRRRELGGYSDAEFDSEFARAHRSDALSVGIRVITLVVVFGLLARAINRHDLPPWLLLLPLAFEFIAIMWVGWLLSRFVVSCEAFSRSAGSGWLVLFWTLLVLAALAAAILFNPGGTGRPDGIDDGLRDAVHWVVRTDLHWALLATLAALLASTSQEVTRWKQVRGVFVWTSIMTAGFRIGVIFLVGFLGFVLAMFTGGFLVELGADFLYGTPGRGAVWGTYGFLLVVELITLVVATLMHRETVQKQAAAGRKA
jgi:hypothetical protein